MVDGSWGRHEPSTIDHQPSTVEVSMGLGEAVRRGRERHPDKDALIVGERSWSYGQFDAITDRLAASLLRLGVRPGDRVALLFTNGAEIVFGYYACFKIGAA